MLFLYLKALKISMASGYDQLKWKLKSQREKKEKRNRTGMSRPLEIHLHTYPTSMPHNSHKTISNYLIKDECKEKEEEKSNDNTFSIIISAFSAEATNNLHMYDMVCSNIKLLVKYFTMCLSCVKSFEIQTENCYEYVHKY